MCSCTTSCRHSSSVRPSLPRTWVVRFAGFTVVVVLDVMFALFGSVGAPLTLAVFVIVMSAEVVFETVTTIVTVARAPALMAPSEHITVVVPEVVVAEQLPPGGGVAETNVVPDGSVSVMVADVAWFGPLLVTVMV